MVFKSLLHGIFVKYSLSCVWCLIKFNKMEQPTSVYIRGMSRYLCSILWSFGLWKPFDKSKIRMISYCTYAIVFLFFFPALYAFCMVCNIFLLTDISELSNRLFMSLTEATLMIKAVNFFMKNNEWQRIYNDIGEFQLKTAKEQETVTYRTRILRNLDYVYFSLANGSLFFTSLTPVVQGTFGLIYSGWYPGFDWENNDRDYWIVYGYQAIGILITANMNLIIDTFYCLMMLMISAHLSILGERMRAIVVRDDDINGIHHARMELIEQIHTHRRINANFELVGKNLEFSYFFQILLSGIVISSIVLEVARVNRRFYR